MPGMKPRLSAAEQKAIIERSIAAFMLSSEAETELRKSQLEDKRFAAGDQWPEGIKKSRSNEGRPCLTINRLKPQIKQVTNQQRSMRPSVKVNPVDGGADVETAETYQGIIRHIETSSDADDAYDQAGNDQVVMGRGFIRIATEYESDKSFNQIIRIERVRRPEGIYFDPACQRKDYSDAGFAHEVFDLKKESYNARYPQSELAGLADWTSVNDAPPDWLNADGVRVAKFWEIELKRETMTVGEGDERRERTLERRTVRCYLHNAVEVLEVFEWPGKYIPIVPVIGEELDIDGKVDLRGMVRDAKDPQRMFNFWKSATTEMIALAPKAPFIIAEGQDEGYEAEWKSANTRNLSRLRYKPTSVAGNLVPPPQRQVAEPPIQALMASSQAAENDLRAATGFYDVGERESREQSGRAIMARQKQGELGNSDFLDGLARAIRHVGRILIDLIPHIYDVPRVLRILGKDNQPKQVMVHAGNAPEAAAGLPPGVEKVYDLSTGTYDVTVTAGPSFQTARQEFVQQMSEVFQGNPALFQLIGDLYFENMDIPNAAQIAERLKKMLPPQLQEQPGQKDIPPAVQAQIQQMGQQMEQMGMALQEAQKVIETKQLELQAQQEMKAAELASKEKIAQIEAELEATKLAMEAQFHQRKLEADLAKSAMQAEAARQSQAAEINRDRERSESEHAHAASMAAAKAAQQPTGGKSE